MRALIFLGVFLTSQTALAQDTLTEERIRDFYQKSVDVQLQGEEPSVAHMKKHMHKESTITMHLVTNVTGMPSHKETRVHSKRDAIKETREGYKLGKLKTIENNVISYEIASDGRTAKVKDTTYMTFVINVPTPKGIVSFNAEQSALCDNDISVNEENTIIINNSVCNAEAKLTPIN